ncbi:PREDICTED: uncharacterized protein LOC109166509 [Ipomoea nil]|uniref:uncharacterized protein LOC109166509 n=1 Tax=Ipomoea nil TaxID=35883 RepID=UPI000901B37E|nr:PREDICTED: uncharacterized protein LOC109166509 [Ipomoea nil]
MSLDWSASSRADESDEVSSSRSHRHHDNCQGAQDGVPPGSWSRFVKSSIGGSKNKRRKPSGSTLPCYTPLFPLEIMQQQYPIDLRIPGAKDYSGKTDPEEHVNSFYGNKIMMGVSDGVICRAFFSTLSGRAAEWFKPLEPGSITCFADLAMKFVRRFATSRTVRKHFTHLEAAKQMEGESLTNFLVKWKNAIGEVKPMDDMTTINVLHYSLRAGAQYQDFIVHPPHTYDEAIRRVTDYANAMEANSAKRRQEFGSGRRDNRSDQRRGDLQQGSRGRLDDLSKLTRPAAEILDYAQGCNLIQLPEPGRDGRDTTKYYAYHRNRGHTTEECRVLKEVIEDLLKEGELTQFIEKKDKGKRWKKLFKRSDKHKKDKDQDPDEEPRSSDSKQVHVIFGGPEGGDSSEERRQWCQNLYVGIIEDG